LALPSRSSRAISDACRLGGTDSAGEGIAAAVIADPSDAARSTPPCVVAMELSKHLRDAHRWLDELLSDPRPTLESLASREGKTVRSIRMTLSLALLAPEIVKAAVEGRLPRGFGLKRLVDLPMAWPDQWRALGLQALAQA
jgi:hypothetical protein